jgi:hypothetical protein
MRQSRQELYKSGAADESWKDKVIILGVVGVCSTFPFGVKIFF